jgi:hypothetical protein
MSSGLLRMNRSSISLLAADGHRPTRFPPATEIQLLTLLHSRAEAHKLS